MGDRQPIRDRTLILRILVPGLETGLRDKMKEMEETAASTKQDSQSVLDLDGVTCEPTGDGSTLWNFHCDGATYPARLVNLPCPVELHKTHDHYMYCKSCDVAQMLIVYEDSVALDEADSFPKTPGFPSYYHSGLTSPLKRVVESRFKQRDHEDVTPPHAEVTDVEEDLLELMNKISKEGGKRNKVPALATAQHANKILEEVVEDVVNCEPWMLDDTGHGIEFDADDPLASKHPELWLDPEKIEEIKAKEREKEEEETRKKQAETAKKEKKKKKKKSAVPSVAKESPSKKKNVAAKKNESQVDDVTNAALSLNAGLGGVDDFLEDWVGDDFDFSNEDSFL
jgi:transcription initiation factor TFIID subunit 7